MGRRGYNEALTKIMNNNIRLERLMSQDKELLPDRRKKRSGPQFHEIRRHADHLYRGLARSWTCDCEDAHCTTLRLDARIPGLRANHQGSITLDCEESLVAFTLTFWSEIESTERSLPWLRQEAEIRVVKHEESMGQPGISAPLGNAGANSMKRESQGPPPSVKTSSGITSKLKKAMKSSSTKRSEGKKAVNFAENPSRAILAAPPSLPEGNLPTQIENLCLTMSWTSMAVDSAERCLGYLDQADHHRLELYLTCRDQVPYHESSKSLADLLTKQTADSGSFRIAPGDLPLAWGERLALSLTVASSVLQLYDTPWLYQYWSKRDILMDVTSTKEIFERVFISTAFPPPATSDVPGCNFSNPTRNLTLFYLGIVLIEITLGRTLESMRTDDDRLDANGQPDIKTHFSIAQRVLEMGIVAREVGVRFEEVVYRLIWTEFGMLNTSLKDDEFRRAVYDGVIAPLEEDLRNFNGL